MALKIGIDIDDVLLGMLHPLNEFHNRVYNTNYKFHDYKDYDLSKTWGGDIKSAIKKIFEFYDSAEFKKLKPKEYAREAVNRFYKNNFKMYVITSRPHEIQDKTEKSIITNFGNKFEDIISTNNFGNYGEKLEKYQVCQKLNIDIMIEDCPKYALDCANNKIYTYLMPMPTNKRINHDYIKRINWKKIIKEFANYI